MGNRLAQETSPYLLAHATNPVDWYPWGDEAFETARRTDRPILLSVGYNACHWCHVMAHESFEDAATAALMNRLFVNIKVDREERPDVDSVYMQAVQALSGRGGWPMTAFLMPDGTPYFGGTYFPPVSRHGMPDFRTVLQAASDAYHERRDAVEAAGAQLLEFLQPPTLRGGGEITEELLRTATFRLFDDVDWDDGGFGGAPKFPHPAAIDFLLQRFARTSDPRAFDAASVCLDRMARGGIFDQVGGGFHRYSVDALWTVPHFEKMLYDNAQLAPVYVHAWQLSGRDRWRDIAEATLDYLVREMRLPGGGFAASQDADSEGGEGAFFVWTPTQLADVLGADDATFAADLFGVTDDGNFEGATVLALPDPVDTVAARLRVPVDSLNVRIRDIRTRLYTARASRPAPVRDDKLITSWNALAIAAFAEAGAVLGRDDYIEVARGAADFILEHLVRDGVLLRTWKDGVAKIAGFLEDVSYLSAALLTLYEATGEERYFTAALDFAGQIEARFSGDDGALYDTATTDLALLVRPRTLDDNPMPAGQSVAALTFLRLYGFTGDDAWRVRALAILTPLAAALERSPLAISTLATAAELALAPMREVAVAGGRDDPRTRALVAAVWRRFEPARVIAWGGGDAVPLLHERPLVDGAPAAYICENFTCSMPVTSVEQLSQMV